MMKLLNLFRRRNKNFGNVGITKYVKKEYYSDALIDLDNSNQFHDLTRTNGKLELSYKDFEYKNEITHCDFSKELLTDEDTIILIWCVDKKLQKKKLWRRN